MWPPHGSAPEPGPLATESTPSAKTTRLQAREAATSVGEELGRTRAVLRGAGIGAMVGAAAFIVFTDLIDVRTPEESSDGGISLAAVATGAVLGGLVGAAIGALVN